MEWKFDYKYSKLVWEVTEDKNLKLSRIELAAKIMDIVAQALYEYEKQPNKEIEA